MTNIPLEIWANDARELVEYARDEDYQRAVDRLFVALRNAELIGCQKGLERGAAALARVTARAQKPDYLITTAIVVATLLGAIVAVSVMLVLR